MKVLRESSAEEMVACYLAGEITSERFGPAIRAQLVARDLPDEAITNADLSDETGNRHRRTILGATRGYGKDREMFTHFPDTVAWVWARLSSRDLALVRYIEYPYWNELSGGSRLPIDAARRIKDGVTVFDVPNTRFLRASDAVEHGTIFPPLILAGPAGDRLVCLEGHLRLTAHALAGFPTELDCLVGIDRTLARWAE
jgi:hypothetical protein